MSDKDFMDIGFRALDKRTAEQNVRKGDRYGGEPVEGSPPGVRYDVLAAAYERCVRQYGERPFAHVVTHVLAHNLFLRDHAIHIQSHRVKDAQDNISWLLGEARSGHPSMFGGYQKDRGPVVMMSVDQLIDLVGDAMTRRSMADLLPASLPVIHEPLEVAPGAPANAAAVGL